MTGEFGYITRRARDIQPGNFVEAATSGNPAKYCAGSVDAAKPAIEHAQIVE